jgi:hypothetical protein
MTINWNDPTERFRHIERVGVDEYNRQFQEHRRQSIVATINGHDIWPVNCRFGRLFMVGGTDTAFRTLDEAKKFATNN